MNALKPCPFCGGVARIYAPDPMFWVSCVDCYVSTSDYPSIEDAVERWNKRLEAKSIDEARRDKSKADLIQ